MGPIQKAKESKRYISNSWTPYVTSTQARQRNQKGKEVIEKKCTKRMMTKESKAQGILILSIHDDGLAQNREYKHSSKLPHS